MSQSAIDFRKLSVNERIQLVEDIWDSIAVESPDAIKLTPAQSAEIQRRLDAHDADPASAVAWEQVRTELFKRQS
jgi:putative addiction module component (TIGR02574 family)